jgi:hypothetical protein
MKDRFGSLARGNVDELHTESGGARQEGREVADTALAFVQRFHLARSTEITGTCRCPPRERREMRMV